MKTTILILFFSFIGLISKGQNDNQLFVTYHFLNFKNNKDQKINLLISPDDSFSEFIEHKAIGKTDGYNEEENSYSFRIESNDSIGKQYYNNGKQIVFRDFVYNDGSLIPVVVTEQTPKLNWILTNEQKKIGSFNCKKAKLDFRGRFYEVWYSLDIPTMFGPWKFQGLPGLIIQASTLDLSISFTLSELKYLDEFEPLSVPKIGKKITFDQYVKYKENAVKNYIDRIKAKLPRGARVKTNSIKDNNLEINFK
ncbi:GLPGLI family protein [uncultured Nonlabens sp.]|uniref:GLPGLI family protein n=1 Tax=uncultured Nonlabens sp. TaxID=859306 RepID=UPI0026032C48|nr:GLPGLI family protein [uncultured Nonlabens sp.]